MFNKVILIIATTVTIMFVTGSYTFYQYSVLKSLERNVESAIVKGIDPITVRCAYAIQTDPICIAYGSISNNNVPPSTPAKK